MTNSKDEYKMRNSWNITIGICYVENGKHVITRQIDPLACTCNSNACKIISFNISSAMICMAAVVVSYYIIISREKYCI